MVPRKGLEPSHREALDPKSSVSTNFTTWAYVRWFERPVFLIVHERNDKRKFTNM